MKEGLEYKDKNRGSQRGSVRSDLVSEIPESLTSGKPWGY